MIRAFRNAAEFAMRTSRPHVYDLVNGRYVAILTYDDDGIETINGAVGWAEAMAYYEFPDGSPFGMKEVCCEAK
jgi:hypothetical protein